MPTLPQQNSPCPQQGGNRYGRCGRSLLASSHAGTRLPIAAFIQGSGRSPSARSRPLRRLAATKNRRHHSGASCKKSFSYDFLRRHYPHQVKGRSLVTSSQPASRAPLCFVFRRVLYTRRGKKARTSFSFAFLPNRFYNFPDYVILVPNFAAPGGAIPRFGALPGTKGD